jgi:hypothetical protein
MTMKIPLICLHFVLTCLWCGQIAAQEKARVVVLTDIENEPDDAQSLVRFLLYSNHFDVEALIATTSTHLRNKTAEWRISEIVKAYGKVQKNLLLHEPGFPTEAYLTSVTKKGIPEYGMQGVGPGKDSQGSDWLIQVVDKNDTRPVWVTVWGGANVLAQALWKVRQTRTHAELQQFVQKLRVYTISDQDDSGHWIRKEFPGVFYIVSPGGNYRNATWSGIAGERWYKFASGANTEIVDNDWLKMHIRENHGPLGAEYPAVEYIMEGDTPSFLGLVRNGLNVPERPDYGGWGGRYELYTPTFKPYQRNDGHEPETRPIWTDAPDEVVGNDGKIYIDNHATIWRWREAYQHDFAARMDWCTKLFKDANHPPVVKINGPSEVTLKPGGSITIDASASTDPDGQSLQFQWIHYPETGNFWHWRGISLENDKSAKLTLKLHPEVEVSTPKVTQVILQVTDTGSPSLTRYHRIFVNIMPK